MVGHSFFVNPLRDEHGGLINACTLWGCLLFAQHPFCDMRLTRHNAFCIVPVVRLKNVNLVVWICDQSDLLAKAIAPRWGYSKGAVVGHTVDDKILVE